MDKVITNLGSAQKRIKTADYMLTMTYETIKEPKLLLTIMNTVFLATKEAIDASLYYERHFKRIPAFNENNFEVKLDIFKRKLSIKYGVKKEELKFIDFLRRIKQEHKDSAVEFSRKENFFIFDDNYKCENLDKEVVKNNIINAKVFIDKIYYIISNKL